MEAKDLERIVASAELRNPKVFNASRERYVAEISFKAGQEAERELLQKAVELIKIWHNGEAVMKLGQEQADYMWNIYYNNAPEMKEIRQALKGDKL